MRNPRNAARQQPTAPASAHPRNPIPGDIRTREIPTQKKSKRANINIATLNMNGFKANGMTNLEKWSRVNKMLNQHKIAILALQETHLDQERTDAIHSAFGKKMDLIYSPLPDNPRASAGVAFVINKALIAPRKVTTHELHAGRALWIKVDWLDEESTVILNVYAPNERTQHADFWEKIETKRRNRRLPVPHFLLGDFNVTEDPLDRMPPRLDDQNAIEALRDVRLAWAVADLLEVCSGHPVVSQR